MANIFSSINAHTNKYYQSYELPKFLHGQTMRSRVASTFSLSRHVNGGSPQGSILGNLLFTVTTDKLAADIEYDQGGHNDCLMNSSSSRTSVGDIFPVDLSLAQIVSDSPSDHGLNNITVEGISQESTCDFSQNGRDITDNHSPEVSYFTHDDFVQSTPTNRGQFQDFIPPRNSINSCLDGTYSSTTGLTFVYMRGHQKQAAIADSTDEIFGAVPE